MKKSKDVRKLSDEELVLEIKAQRRKVFDLKSQAVTEKIEDTSQFSRERRHVARLLTEQTARSRQAKEAS